MLELGRIHFGDCLELMPRLPAGSVDMILADLPYGSTKCPWDVVIPFEPLWAEYRRVIKPGGAIVLTGSQPFTSLLVTSNLAMFRYEWIWKKTVAANFQQSRTRPRKLHENVLVFADKEPTYYPQMEAGKPYKDRERARSARVLGEGVLSRKKAIENPGIRFPSSVQAFAPEFPEWLEEEIAHSVQEFPNPNNGSIHATQKPVPLFEYLIRTYTRPGELVLDNCMGSGTTAIAALNTDRRWVGMEKDPPNHEAASWRVLDHLRTR